MHNGMLWVGNEESDDDVVSMRVVFSILISLAFFFTIFKSLLMRVVGCLDGSTLHSFPLFSSRLSLYFCRISSCMIVVVNPTDAFHHAYYHCHKVVYYSTYALHC